MNSNRMIAGLATAFALLAASGPAMGQEVVGSAAAEAPVPVTEAGPADAISEEEAAFNAQSAAMSERVQAYDAEFKTVAHELAAEPEALHARLEDIEARFQAEMDAFIQAFIDFSVVKEAELTQEERQLQRDRVLAMVPQLGSVPSSLRHQAEAAAAATRAGGPATPET